MTVSFSSVVASSATCVLHVSLFLIVYVSVSASVSAVCLRLNVARRCAMDAINYFVAFVQSFQAALKNVVNADSVKLVEECVEAAQDALAIVLKEYSHASF